VATCESYEAVVVGGGPAGSAAAYTLAAAGKKVCLIDKAEFPRDKLCGGGLTFRSKSAFERIFKRPWKAELFNSSRDFLFSSNGRFVASYRSRANIYFMMRRSFDHYLLGLARDAGATLRLGDAVGNIDLAEKSLTLRSGQEIAFGFLIGADGVNSVVAKTLFGKSFDPATVAFTLEAEVPRDRLPHQGDRVEFDFNAARWGYGWVFPKQDFVTIGIGGMHRLNPDLRRRLDAYFQHKGLDAKDFKVKGQYLPCGDCRAVPGRSNVLLCGDAAGAVDPISGEGIPYALLTGAAAGTAVATALSQPAGRGALAIYCEDYRDIVASFRRAKFWRRFVCSRVMQRVFAWAFRVERVRKWLLVEG
jgi:geranylgeranyl reductase family protein